MPPIPIHKNDPIHPAATKPDGATPQSADPNVPPPTRTLPVSVPATTTASADNPPLPQPGARPIPPTAAAAIQAPSSSVPAPPQPQHRPGDGYSATHITTETRQASLPEQFHHPPPSDSQLAGRYTTTSTTASKPGPTTLNLGPATSQFQNEHSQGGLGATRTSSEGERRSLEHPPGYVQAPDNAPYTTSGGIGLHESGGTSDSGAGGAAWNMLTKAGEALKKGEEAAWRAVRNK